MNRVEGAAARQHHPSPPPKNERERAQAIASERKRERERASERAQEREQERKQEKKQERERRDETRRDDFRGAPRLFASSSSASPHAQSVSVFFSRKNTILSKKYKYAIIITI